MPPKRSKHDSDTPSLGASPESWRAWCASGLNENHSRARDPRRSGAPSSGGSPTSSAPVRASCTDKDVRSLPLTPPAPRAGSRSSTSLAHRPAPRAPRPTPRAPRPVPIAPRPAPHAPRPSPRAHRPVPIAPCPPPIAHRPSPIAPRPPPKPRAHPTVRASDAPHALPSPHPRQPREQPVEPPDQPLALPIPLHLDHPRHHPDLHRRRNLQHLSPCNPVRPAASATFKHALIAARIA